MIIKKKLGDSGKYEIVKDVVTFETPNKHLLERVASESSQIESTQKLKQKNAPKNFATRDLTEVKFELEVRGYGAALTNQIKSLVDCEYGV